MEGISLFAGISGLIILRKWHVNYNKPKLIFQNIKQNVSRVQKCPTLVEYCPPALFAFDWHGHIHTAIGTFFRFLLQTRIDFYREYLTLPDDGTVALDWILPLSSSKPNSPIVVLIHGLCGSTESPYISYAAKKFHSEGFTVVSFIARGCGGVPLTSPESFTAARTSDLAYALNHINVKHPNRKIFCIGYSLGAGILLKHVGELGIHHLTESPITAAVAVSPSWNFLEETVCFDLWSRYVLADGLKQYVSSNLSYLAENPGKMDLEKILQSKTVREFDHYAVVPVHGYRDVDHYYNDSSAINTAHTITIPTLVLSAADDPVCTIKGSPTDANSIGEGVVIAVTRTGGHVVFANGLFLTTRSWMDESALEWFRSFEDN